MDSICHWYYNRKYGKPAKFLLKQPDRTWKTTRKNRFSFCVGEEIKIEFSNMTRHGKILTCDLDYYDHSKRKWKKTVIYHGIVDPMKRKRFRHTFKFSSKREQTICISTRHERYGHLADVQVFFLKVTPETN